MYEVLVDGITCYFCKEDWSVDPMTYLSKSPHTPIKARKAYVTSRLSNEVILVSIRTNLWSFKFNSKMAEANHKLAIILLVRPICQIYIKKII